MSAPATVDPTNTLAVLKAAREWLSDPAHWTTHVLWRAADGRALARSVDDLDRYDLPLCASTCASGAIFYVTGGQFPDAANEALTQAVGEDDEGIVCVNDGHDGYARILAGYDKAIADLEAERGDEQARDAIDTDPWEMDMRPDHPSDVPF